MQSLTLASGYSRIGTDAWRWPMGRLPSLVSAAVLLCGLLTVWGGPLPMPVAFAADGDWTQYRGGPAHQGYSAAEHTISISNVGGLGVAWTGASGGDMSSSPAVADGVVYVGSQDGKLYAFAVGCNSGGGTCAPLWTGATGGVIENSSPAIADGVVYIGSVDEKLYAFGVGCNSGGGACSPLWTATTGGYISSSPAVAGGVVYVASAGGSLYAFDTVTCTGGGGSCAPIWTATTGYQIDTSPAVANGVVYLAAGLQLYAYPALCRSDGGICAPLWTASIGETWASSPAVSDGVVYVGSWEDHLAAFDAAGLSGCGGVPKTCAPLWTATTNGSVRSSPAVASGVVYVGANHSELEAFDAIGVTGCTGSPKTCVALWTGSTDGAIYSSSPAVANGVVYVGTEHGKLHAFDAAGAVGCNGSPKTCAPVWTGAVGGAIYSSPAIANGVVYVGSSPDANKLYAFSLPAPATNLTVATANPYVAGSAHSLTVTAKDAHGNTAAGYRGTIHLTSSDSAAVLPADYTFTAADAGVHKFATGFTLKTAGSRWVRATDTVTASITGSQTVSVTVGPVKTLAVATVNPYLAGAAHSLTVTAKDAGDNTVTGYLGTVHLTSSDPAAVLPADYTFTAADAGVHKFSAGFTLKTAGSRSVTATDTVTASITGTQSGITVTPGAVRTLSVATATSFVAGASHTVTITARDAYGNVATGYLGTVHLTSSDPAAVLPADYTFIGGDAGVHRLTLALETAGSRSVTVRDTVTASITGTQNGITVTPGAAKRFALVGAVPWLAGASHSVTVTARDAYGNVATGYLGTVHLTSSDPAAVLPADYTFVVGDAGVHKLTVKLKTAGSQWIHATDTVTATITGSQTITVS